MLDDISLIRKPIVGQYDSKKHQSLSIHWIVATPFSMEFSLPVTNKPFRLVLEVSWHNADGGRTVLNLTEIILQPP